MFKGASLRPIAALSLKEGCVGLCEVFGADTLAVKELPKIILIVVCFVFVSRLWATSESLKDSRKKASGEWERCRRWCNAGEVVKGFSGSIKICKIKGNPCAKFRQHWKIPKNI